MDQLAAASYVDRCSTLNVSGDEGDLDRWGFKRRAVLGMSGGEGVVKIIS